MIVGEWIPNKFNNLSPTEVNKTETVRAIKIITRSKSFDSCDKDIKCMNRKLSRLLAVVNDWGNDETPDIAVAIHKALEETIKRIQSDVEFSLRAYRIDDEEEKLELTKEITELINKAKKLLIRRKTNMKLYHFTRRENVLNMYKEGIRPGSFWCRSIEDCRLFLGLYMKAGLIPSPCDIAYVSIDFEEDEVIESDDHNRKFIDCDVFFCPERIDKSRMPKLFDIPLFTTSI